MKSFFSNSLVAIALACIACTSCNRQEVAENADSKPHPKQSNDRVLEETEEAKELASVSAPANPVESNPVESNPVESNPVESNPVESNPLESNPLEEITEEEAIELSRAALKDQGYDISKLRPVEYSDNFQEEDTERLFMRALPNERGLIGRTFWARPGNRHWSYVIWIKKVNSELEFEVYRTK